MVRPLALYVKTGEISYNLFPCSGGPTSRHALSRQRIYLNTFYLAICDFHSFLWLYCPFCCLLLFCFLLEMRAEPPADLTGAIYPPPSASLHPPPPPPPPQRQTMLTVETSLNNNHYYRQARFITLND